MICLALCNEMRGRRRYSFNPSKGFCVKTRRLGVVGLRVKVLHFLRLMCRWKWKPGTSSCKAEPKLIKQSVHAPSSTTTGDLRNRRRRRMETEAKVGDSCRNSTSFDLSSSLFYSEAIADCLEFIKMSALSSEDPSKQVEVDNVLIMP